MATRLMLRKGSEPTKTVYVAQCPLFEDPDTAEAKALLDDGWLIAWHVDGATDPSTATTDTQEG